MAGEASKAHSSDQRRIFSTSTFYSLMTTARFSWYGTVSFIKHEESSWIVPCAGFEVVGLKLISFLTPFLFKVGGRGLGSVSRVLQFSQHRFLRRFLPPSRLVMFLRVGWLSLHGLVISGCPVSLVCVSQLLFLALKPAKK